MSVDTREPRTVKEQVRVQAIEDPGKYKLETTSNRRLLLSWESYIPHRLHEQFPDIWTARFYAASLQGGKYTPARLDHLPEWEGLRGNSAYIGLGGETYAISADGTYSNGGGSWQFAIKDIGNLAVVENNLEIDSPRDRDGSISLFYSGTAPHHTTKGGSGSWKGSIDYSGEHPGRLVTATIDNLNQLIESSGAVLSRETVVSG